MRATARRAWIGAARGDRVLTGAARADAVEDFYKGKTITLFVGAGVGGSYDMYARLLAPTLSKHIPGNPTVVVKLILGGGGGLPAAIHMQRTRGARRHVDRHDAADHRGRAAHRVGRGRQIRRQHLGLARPDGADPQHARGLAHRAGADAGGSAAEGGHRRRQRPHLADHIVPQVLNEIHGTKFKIIQGYNGISGLNLAMERGEIQGRGASWLSVVTATPHYITEKKLKPLVFEGLSKEPGFPDVPLLDRARQDRPADGRRWR